MTWRAPRRTLPAATNPAPRTPPRGTSKLRSWRRNWRRPSGVRSCRMWLCLPPAVAMVPAARPQPCSLLCTLLSSLHSSRAPNFAYCSISRAPLRTAAHHRLICLRANRTAVLACTAACFPHQPGPLRRLACRRARATAAGCLSFRVAARGASGRRHAAKYL